MSRKIQTAQRPYTLLVANLKGGSDPSKGVAGNPDKARTGFTYQHFPDVNRVANDRGSEPDPSTPGVDTKMGLVDYTTEPVPVLASADIVVADDDFTAVARLFIGQFELISGEDFDVTTGTTYPNEDITNTAPNSALTLFDTAGPNLIDVPANLPIAAGTVTINWTSGGSGYSQSDDGAGGFTGDGTPGSSAIDYTTGAITLDTAALPPDTGTSITITYTAEPTTGDVATALEAAIEALPGFTASVVGSTITVEGPAGPGGNHILLEAMYEDAVQNYTLPDAGTLGAGEPTIGPPEILP